MVSQGTGQFGKSFVGVISDTHGLVRPQALAALAGAERIIHAGDIGRPAVLTALETIAPVVAVRGNNDQDAWAAAIPETAVVEVDGLRLYVLHDVKTLDFDPATAGFSGVICGHSHRPRLEQQAEVWYQPRQCWSQAFYPASDRCPALRAGGRLTQSWWNCTFRRA